MFFLCIKVYVHHRGLVVSLSSLTWAKLKLSTLKLEKETRKKNSSFDFFHAQNRHKTQNHIENKIEEERKNEEKNHFVGDSSVRPEKVTDN